MESILHIEPLTVEIKNEESVGETEYVFYGSGELDEDDEDVGRLASYIRLGAPLELVPGGPVSRPIKLAKSFEYYPDFSGCFKNVFTETIHLVDKKYFIPIRTSIRVGPGECLKYTHIPSLDLARSSVGGSFPSPIPFYVCDPLYEMVDNILKNDRVLKNKSHHPIIEWIRDDLLDILSKQMTISSTFNGLEFPEKMIKFKNQIVDAPYADLSPRYVAEVLKNLLDGREHVPFFHRIDSPVRKSFEEFRIKAVNHSGDFKSYGDMTFSDKSSIETNPKNFLKTLDFLDNLGFTDLNVDMILADGEIVKVYTHIALDRVSKFAFDWDKKESQVLDMTNRFDVEDILTILREFITHLQHRNDIVDMLVLEPLKIKIVKTIKDQVAFLIYKFNSGPQDSPICGVHFDIPLLALAPLSVVPGYS